MLRVKLWYPALTARTLYLLSRLSHPSALLFDVGIWCLLLLAVLGRKEQEDFYAGMKLVGDESCMLCLV